MRYQLWQGSGCVVDMECDTAASDNTAQDFIEQIAAWLEEEPRSDYRIHTAVAIVD